MGTIAEIATVLRTTEGNAMRRVFGMRLWNTYCGRCGGSGQYSFNGSHSNCYGCNGRGAPTQTERDYPGILENAKAAVADGRLDKYLTYLESAAIAKNATRKVLDAWQATGISNQYDWRKSAEFSRLGLPEYKRDHDISQINRKMADAYNVVNKCAMKLNPKVETYRDDVIVLAGYVKEALAAIADAEEELKDYLTA